MIARLRDGLWPRRCELCDRAVDRPGRHVCSDCLMRLPFRPPDGCAVCARDMGAGSAELLCEACASRGRPCFDRAANAVRFEGAARQMVLDYKFNGHLWLRDDFTDWLEAAARARFAVEAVDAVLPMPSTLLHRYDRGYNPCRPLATALAKRLARRCDPSRLRRVGSPRRQAGLSAEERVENVKGTFAVRGREHLAGRTVLVVDDVMTTGATLSECARTLKAAGVWRVWALTLARAVQ